MISLSPFPAAAFPNLLVRLFPYFPVSTTAYRPKFRRETAPREFPGAVALCSPASSSSCLPSTPFDQLIFEGRLSLGTRADALRPPPLALPCFSFLPFGRRRAVVRVVIASSATLSTGISYSSLTSRRNERWRVVGGPLRRINSYGVFHGPSVSKWPALPARGAARI